MVERTVIPLFTFQEMYHIKMYINIAIYNYTLREDPP